MFKGLIIAAALIAAPSENYYSWVSPEIADVIMAEVAEGNYHAYLDYDGNGKLEVADAVQVARRYKQNCDYGNSYTLTADGIRDIIAENYSDVIDWEICRVNGEVCREYMLTTTEVTEAEIRVETTSETSYIAVEVDPYMEIASVKED